MKGLTVRKVVEESFGTAVEKGWWDYERPIGELFMLMTTEIAEAFEEYRSGHDARHIYYENGKPEGIPIELADCVIRIADFCGKYEIDLEHALREKLEFNKSRPYRHGGKKA